MLFLIELTLYCLLGNIVLFFIDVAILTYIGYNRYYRKIVEAIHDGLAIGAVVTFILWCLSVTM